MLSKSQIENCVFICCKCNTRLENVEKYYPIQLPCFHLICSICVASLKMKFYFHCNTLKLFMLYAPPKFNDDSSVTLIHDQIKQVELNQRNDFVDEFKEKFIQSLDHLNRVDFDLIREYLGCQKCRNAFDSRLHSPIRLPCLHSMCKRCFDAHAKSSSSYFVECSSCLLKFYRAYSSFAQDLELLDLIRAVDSIISERQSQTLAKMERFMLDFDKKIEDLSVKLSQDTYYEELVESAAAKLNEIPDILNSKRSELLETLKKVYLIENVRVLDELKEKASQNPALAQTLIPEVSSVRKNCLHFKKSKLNLDSIELIGHFKQVGRIEKRIKFLKLNKYFLNFNCQSKQITQPLIQITGFNWIRQCPKADFLISFSLNKIFYICLNNQFANSLANSYKMKLTNSTLGVKMIEANFTTRMKVQYCRGFDKIFLILFEKNYEKEYELRVYDSTSLSFIAKVDFSYFIENVCVNSSEIASWSSERAPYMKFFSYSLKPTESNRTKYDAKIFDKFYLMPDFTDDVLVFHNQSCIGLVSRRSGEIVHEINLCDYKDETDEIRENEHQIRNRSYLSQTKSEYLNLKCYNGEYLIVTTWAKIYLFKLNENFDLLVKNDLFCVLNNNWYIPNRLYINNDGYISFFDPSSSFITFI